MGRGQTFGCLVAWLLLVGPQGPLASAVAPHLFEGPGDAEGESDIELLGWLTREEIEAALPSWVEAEIVARPDAEAAQQLPGALIGHQVTVFLGTWCSDSRRELPRLWRALDEAGAVQPTEIRYIGVDRDKVEPRELVAGSDLRLVPTLVVSRNDREMGRIVESSPAGIERDLLDLLTGRQEGLITSSAKLLGSAPGDSEE